MKELLFAGLGGFIGAMLRYGTNLACSRWNHPFPAATLLVNAAGCFFIGLLLGEAEKSVQLPPATKAFLVTGILGGLTTFSAFGYETVTLLKTGNHFSAMANIFLNVSVGVTAAWLGMHLVQGRN